MKKIFLILLIIILNLTSFAASELDSLLQDDEDVFSELVSDDDSLEAKEAYVEELIGQAFVQREEAEKWFQIVKDTAIKEKDTVLTMENSSMKIRMEDETYINVGAKSKLYFATMRGKPETELMTETGLKLAFGKVFSNVRKKLEKGGRYEIEVGSVVAGVRGTQYDVSIDKKKEVKIKVYEGKVIVLPTEIYIQQREAEKKKEEEEKQEEAAAEDSDDDTSEDDGENAATDESEEDTDESVEEDTSEETDEQTTEEQASAEEAKAEETPEEKLPEEQPILIEETVANEEAVEIAVETQSETLAFETEGIVVNANEEINVEISGSIGDIVVHNDVAPTQIVQKTAVQEQIEVIKEEAAEVLKITPEELKKKKEEASAEEESEEEQTEEEKQDEETQAVSEETLIDQQLDLETVIEDLVTPQDIPETVVTETPRGNISVKVK